MNTGRRASDWLSDDAAADAAVEERSGADRRAADRRAPRRRLDPMFAATLVNQIAPAQTTITSGYGPNEPSLRAGVVVNLKA
jgi:hypothetical protein